MVFKPFSHTKVDTSYETGQRFPSLSATGKAVDQRSLWLGNNRPLADGASALARPLARPAIPNAA